MSLSELSPHAQLLTSFSRNAHFDAKVCAFSGFGFHVASDLEHTSLVGQIQGASTALAKRRQTKIR